MAEKQHYILGMRGTGPTVAEARIDASQRLERLACDMRAGPLLVTFDGAQVLVWRDALGWNTTAITIPHGAGKVPTQRASGPLCGGSVQERRDDAVRSAVLQAAEMAWSHKVTDDRGFIARVIGLGLVAGVDEADVINKLRAWIVFQRVHARVVAEGVDSHEAHRLACEAMHDPALELRMVTERMRGFVQDKRDELVVPGTTSEKVAA